MGVRIECWRTSRGRFYSKLGFNRKKNISFTSSSIKDNIVEILKYILVKSFKLSFGLLTVIAYCLSIIVRMPLFYAGHLHAKTEN